MYVLLILRSMNYRIEIMKKSERFIFECGEEIRSSSEEEDTVFDTIPFTPLYPLHISI